MKCVNCLKEKCITKIYNYVIRYESWEAYNCCCKECAIQSAGSDSIKEEEIISIEGGD